MMESENADENSDKSIITTVHVSNKQSIDLT